MTSIETVPQIALPAEGLEINVFPPTEESFTESDAEPANVEPANAEPTDVEPAGADQSDQELVRVEPTEPVQVSELPLGQTIRRFDNVIRRNSAFVPHQSDRDPLAFYADTRLTPIKVSNEIYQVLSSMPGLQSPNFKWKYSMVYHGKLTYSWSLLKLGPTFQTTSSVLRPLAILETSSNKFGRSEMMVTNLEHPLEARSIKLSHYYDSWSTGGNHVGFELDCDFAYEWQPVECVPGSGHYELYLWRINLIDPTHAVPAARIVEQELIQNPMKAGSKEALWCVEVDLDRVPVHIALVSAFAIKATNSLFHAWFAPKITKISPAMPLVNFAFQDEGRVLQRSQKFWGDWEESRARNDGENESVDFNKVLLIRVFNKAYIKSYAVPNEILDMLNAEANHKIALFRAKFSIYD